MRFTYDPEADALSVELDEAAFSARTIHVGPHCAVDLDAGDRLISVEVLGASFLYPPDVLEQLPSPRQEITLAHAEAEYGIPAPALRRLIRSGSLDGRKEGRTWRVSLAAMETYLYNIGR